MLEHDKIRGERLETESIVVGYAMSRLDRRYLDDFGISSWSDAFANAGSTLNRPAATFKNLRDEFDPYHSNSRQGWHLRSIRQNRQRVIDELADVSDDALLELVRSILGGRESEVADAVDALAVKTKIAYNVAERLLTGRRAETYFIENSSNIADISRDLLIDLRDAACGFDFGSQNQPKLAIEVKGLKQLSGSIQFTDYEWNVAKIRGNDYLLVVVGNLIAEPRAISIRDPHAVLTASCRYQKSVTATWQSHVSL